MAIEDTEIANVVMCVLQAWELRAHYWPSAYPSTDQQAEMATEAYHALWFLYGRITEDQTPSNPQE